MSDLLIRGGLVVTAEGRREADVRVTHGRIAEVGPGLAPRGERVIAVPDRVVLPGGVDPHVHLTWPPTLDADERWVDDFTTGSRAALAGGITTVGNMAFPRRGETPEQTIAREARLVERQAIADVILHPVIDDPGSHVRETLDGLVKAGQPGIKIFLSTQTFDARYDEYLAVIRRAGTARLLTLLHCEDADTIRRATATLVRAGKTGLRYFAESRPVESERLAVERAVEVCRETGAAVYLVHVSSAAALGVATRARTDGLPVFVETRPEYLYLTRERYADTHPGLYVGTPPLREDHDVEALWHGIATGTVDTLGSDHAPWSRTQKLDPTLDVTRLRPGVNNLQVMLPLLYDEGVGRRGLALEHFVALTSTNAARLFGLYPAKGTIAAGSDADLAIWQPDATRVIDAGGLFSRAGFSIYEGRAVRGWPELTIRRGEVVYEHGVVTGAPGSGRLGRRGLWIVPFPHR